MKTCNTCESIKEISDFHMRSRSIDGRSAKCKTCCKSYRLANKDRDNSVKRQYAKTNAERCREWKKRDAEKNPLAQKNRNLRFSFGITIDQYNDMHLSQKGRCKICNRNQSELKMSLAVDHDHKTGKIRGLLCAPCNQGIGHLKDSTDIILSAFSYLKEGSSCPWT